MEMNTNIINETRQKVTFHLFSLEVTAYVQAQALSSSDEVGNLLQKSVNFFSVLINSNSSPKVLQMQ